MMEYQQLEYCASPDVLIVRFIPRSGHQAVRTLRDELVDLVLRLDPPYLVVDFQDLHSWPAETLICLAEARRAMTADSPIHTVGLTFRLQAAVRLLGFEGDLIQQFATIDAAIQLPERNAAPARVAPTPDMMLPTPLTHWEPGLARSA